MDSDNRRAKKDELTRRDWLVKIGRSAAVAGLCGEAGEAADELSRLAQTAATREMLPPGLYEPSNDHLTHALGADGLFHPVPAGSETVFRTPCANPYEPQFFAQGDFRIIGRLVELMLGEPAGSSETADTPEGGPGSVTADVAEWVDFVAANSGGAREAALKLAADHRNLAVAYNGLETVEREEKTDVTSICREGLAWLAKRAPEKFGGEFLALDQPAQVELLREISDEPDPAGAGPEPGRKFFRWMKRQIINGFYRSPAGLKELDYKGNSFYAESPGCSGRDPSGE
jgi:gluconate 2-dehydrogenase subunit 3-like protein